MLTPACDHRPMRINIYVYVYVYNNKVICHFSRKLSDRFCPNQMYTSDKIVVKHISVKETLLKLDLEPKGQSYSKQQNNKQGNKNIPPLNKQTKALLGNCSATDESNRLGMTHLGEQKKVNKGQELSG